MKYQLVLQWPASSIDDYESMIELEKLLMEGLTPGSEIDGHDAGSGEINIFVRTNEPKRAFEEVKSILGRQDLWSNIRVAYRELDATKYTIIWPKNLKDFRIT